MLGLSENRFGKDGPQVELGFPIVRTMIPANIGEYRLTPSKLCLRKRILKRPSPILKAR